MHDLLHSRRRPGFTLIELMVVLALIAVMTAVIIPEMRGTFQDALLRSSARKLVDVLSLANSRAVTLNQPQRVRFDETNRRYTLERRGHDGEPAFVAVDVNGARGVLDDQIQLSVRKNDETTDDPAK